MNKLLFDLDINLLEKTDAVGINKLDIFDKYGTRAAITDFAILLGGAVSSDYHTCDEDDLKDRTGWWCTKSSSSYRNDGTLYGVDFCGARSGGTFNMRSGGVRPVITYSSIIKESLNRRVNNLGVYEVKYGEYPQTIVNEVLSNELEKLCKSDKLQKTGKEYLTDSVYWNEYNKPFQERKLIEYKYNGQKYMRILESYNSKGKMLSDGRRVQEGKSYWVKVEPIVWLVDEKRNLAVSKKLLFSGVQFCDEDEYDGNFKNTRMKWFLDTHFSKDIIPSNNKIKYYLVSSNNINFLAYEKDDVLKELYSNIDLVPENANYYPENALICNYDEIKEITLEEVKEYLLNTDKITYLKYLKEVCEHSNNKILYKRLSKEYTKEKIKNTLSLKL